MVASDEAMRVGLNLLVLADLPTTTVRRLFTVPKFRSSYSQGRGARRVFRHMPESVPQSHTDEACLRTFVVALKAFGEEAARTKVSYAERYNAGKRLVADIFVAMKTSNGVRSIPADEIEEILYSISVYFALGLSTPSVLHSPILYKLTMLANAGHVQLGDWIGRFEAGHLFLRTDFKRRPPAKPTSGSEKCLVEMVVEQLSIEALTAQDKLQMTTLLEQIDPLLRNMEVPSTLLSVKSNLLAGLGRRPEAIQIAWEVVLLNQTKSWAWDRLGDVLVDVPRKIACYAKATTCTKSVSAVGRVRLKLINLLSADGQFDRARTLLDEAIALKEAKGMNVRSENLLIEQDWYASASPLPDGGELCFELARGADEWAGQQRGF